MYCKNYYNNGMCIYKHSDETREQWLNRTKIFRSEMPLTNENDIIEDDKKYHHKLKPNVVIPIELSFVENLNKFMSKKINTQR
jgi:hypothetical protein